MAEAIALEMLLERLRAERPAKLSKVIKSKMRFSGAALAPEEMSDLTSMDHTSWPEAIVTEYQYRALAVLGEDFHRYACRKYPPEASCVFLVEEFKPMFNEIHRGVTHFVGQGLSVHDALKTFIKGKDFLAEAVEA